MTETPNQCLDLFCGLGGFSAAFDDSPGWEVTTVDIEERFNPDICANVMDLRPSDFQKDFDVVLASPPCTQFSRVAWSHGKRITKNGAPLTDDAADAINLVHHAIGLVKGLSPKYWFLENPKGALRWVIGDPVATVDYCRYGHYTKKPTDFWGRHPTISFKRCDHETHTQNGVSDFEAGSSKASERAKVPYELSQAILDAVEGRAEQSTLMEVVRDD